MVANKTPGPPSLAHPMFRWIAGRTKDLCHSRQSAAQVNGQPRNDTFSTGNMCFEPGCLNMLDLEGLLDYRRTCLFEGSLHSLEKASLLVFKVPTCFAVVVVSADGGYCIEAPCLVRYASLAIS